MLASTQNMLGTKTTTIFILSLICLDATILRKAQVGAKSMFDIASKISYLIGTMTPRLINAALHFFAIRKIIYSDLDAA
jgi:hypothetical protein